MRLTDRFVIRDKITEKTLRNLDGYLDNFAALNTLDKERFMEINYTFLELLVTVFKRLDDNTTPARTLLEFTGKEVQDAVNRVGPSHVFDEDANYVIAVMQELTKR